MKQIEEYIKSNKELKEHYIERFNETDPEDINTLERLKMNIERIDYYIKGLEDAKKYIEEENR